MWIDAHSHQAMRMRQIGFAVNIHLNCIFHARQAENSHDALLYKPINEELIDPSSCIGIFLLFSFARVTEKHTASNLERVTPCKYLLDFWCEHTIMCVHQKRIKLFTSRLHTLKSMRNANRRELCDVIVANVQ